MTAAPAHRALPAWLAPAVLLALVIVAFTSVLLLARRAAAPDVPPEPPAFRAPSPARPITSLDVQQAAGGRLTLSDGSRDAQLAQGARVEVLRPAQPTEVHTGDWLAVIGVPNEVRNFSIRSLVLLADPSTPDAEGVVRSPGGFAGHEASRDQSERPLLGGVVSSFDGRRITVQGPAGPLAVDLSPNAPLRRLVEGRPDQIAEGDRIAFPAGNPISDARGVLVLPGGAR